MVNELSSADFSCVASLTFLKQWRIPHFSRKKTRARNGAPLGFLDPAFIGELEAVLGHHFLFFYPDDRDGGVFSWQRECQGRAGGLVAEIDGCVADGV